MNGNIQTRRGFISTAFGAALFNIVPARVLASASAPSNQLTRAIVGFGKIAHSANHIGYDGSRLIAVCDPDAGHLANGVGYAAKRGYGKVFGCRDFRDVLAMKDVDIVHICTPPHWHGLIAKLAAEAGKDIWCEKPMTRTLGEGKRVMEVVKARGRMFRLNTWFRFQDDFYKFGAPVKPLKKAVLARLFGWPLTVTVGPGQGLDFNNYWWCGRTDLAPEPVPASLDYNLWLGPAPFKPYNHAMLHEAFRGYWDYDSGSLGDMGQHYLDPVQYLLEKDGTSPLRVEVDCDPQDSYAVGRFRRIEYFYADGCRIVVDGDGSLCREPFISGPQGWVRPGLKSNLPRFAEILKDLPEPPAQQTDFADSVRRRNRFALNETNGFRSCALVCLGAAAMRLGRGFRFDPVKLCAVDDPSADRFLYQKMRGPWKM